MYRWCSFCVSYMGQKEPFEDSHITHGICGSCEKDAQSGKSDDSKLDAVRELNSILFRRLASDLDIADLHTRAQVIGIRDWDFLMAVMQPYLSWLGQEIAQGRASVADEHRLSSQLERLLNRLEPDPRPLWEQPGGVLLATADGNYHSLGVRVLGFILRRHGIVCTELYPSVPIEALQAAIEKFKPKAVGISIALEEHVPYIKKALDVWGDKETYLAFGGGFFEAKNHIEGLQSFGPEHSPQEVLDWIREKIAK